MSLDASLPDVLREPDSESLWRLRADLVVLADCAPATARDDASWSLEIVGRFHAFLADVQVKMTAHEYSRIASKMDIGSVGLLALQDLTTGRERLFEKLLLGGLSEALMVLAALQYVKAWKAEASQACEDASWWLFEGLWRLSSQMKPDVPAADRRAQIETALAPARSPETAPPVRAAFLAQVFQVLLVCSLGWTTPLVVPPAPAA